MAKTRLRRPLTLVVLYAGFLTFLFSTDPRKLAISWLILPFLWLYFSLFLTAIYAIDWLSADHRHNRRQTVVAMLAAAIPTTMLLLDSVDQLTVKDSLLIFGLGGLALFYASKISLKRNVF
jgi:hypothetical protein